MILILENSKAIVYIMTLVKKQDDLDHKIKSIGLIGGSFNPAHEGHIYLSEQAFKKIKLDEIWWLVSPQNPLKSNEDTAPFMQRFNYAQKLVHNPKIKVCDFEKKIGSQYTVDTLSALQKSYPELKFIWIMGADNLAQIVKWKNWRQIFRLVPIAVFDRNQYSCRVNFLKAVKVFKHKRVTGVKLFRLSNLKPPAWGFFKIKNNPLSSTQIRNHNFHYE